MTARQTQVADIRRTYVGKFRKHVDKPPKIAAVRGRLAKKLEKYKAKLRQLLKVGQPLTSLSCVGAHIHGMHASNVSLGAQLQSPPLPISCGAIILL